MTLPFSLYHGGKPTNFPEKIIGGLLDNSLVDPFNCIHLITELESQIPEYPFLSDTIVPKIHTIRGDNSNRWNEGMDIHFVINNRSKNRFQFAPVIKCTRVQEIYMTYAYSDAIDISVDNQYLSRTECYELAMNDGFVNWSAFFNWFYPIITASPEQYFAGKIIHWTDLKY